ncbi:MAG: hypothetical protein ABR592_10740 [Nitriliruptorales bacterium]
MENCEPKLSELLSRIGPMAWTPGWLGVLNPTAPFRGREAGPVDVISPLVTELIAYEVVSQPDAA